MLDDLGDAADRGRDNGETSRHGFDNRQGKTLPIRREREDVCGRQNLRDIAANT